MAKFTKPIIGKPFLQSTDHVTDKAVRLLHAKFSNNNNTDITPLFKVIRLLIQRTSKKSIPTDLSQQIKSRVIYFSFSKNSLISTYRFPVCGFHVSCQLNYVRRLYILTTLLITKESLA